MIKITECLSADELKLMPKSSVIKLQESINKYINDYETMMESKFESLTESLTEKFNQSITEAVVSGVHSRVNQDVDKKMKDTLQSVMNLLESNGFHVSEETRNLTKKVEMLEDEIARGAKIHQQLKSELDNAKKKDYIRERLAGMNPNIIADALRYYDSKTMYDVEDTIDMFVDNDYKKLVPHSNQDEYQDKMGDIEIEDFNDIVASSENRKGKFESITNRKSIMLSSHSFTLDDGEKVVNESAIQYDDEDVSNTMRINERYESFNFR